MNTRTSFYKFINFLNCYNINYSIRRLGNSKYVKIIKLNNSNSDGLGNIYPCAEFEFNNNEVKLRSRKLSDKKDIEVFQEMFQELKIHYRTCSSSSPKYQKYNSPLWIEIADINNPDVHEYIIAFYFNHKGKFLGYEVTR